MINSLRELLNKEEIISTFKRKEFEVKVWAGLKRPYARILEAQRCYEPFGLFKYIIREKNIPRVVSAVIKDKRIVSWAMLMDESFNMRWFNADPSEYIEVHGITYKKYYSSLGYIGYYTVPEYRRSGYATIALKKLDDVVVSLLPENSIDEYSYFGQINVKNHQDRVCRIKVLPFSSLEELSTKCILLK